MRFQDDNKSYGTASLPFSLLNQFFLIGAILIVYVFDPITYARFIAEDNWGEFATFVSDLLAAFIFFFLFVSKTGNQRNLWYLALGIGTFVVGMEEVN